MPLLADDRRWALLAACAVGPNYHRPSAPVPQAFKEADGWKPAEPRAPASAQPLVVGVRGSGAR